MTNEPTALRAEPDADWNNIWTAMQELGAAVAPLMELASPPSWAVSLRFVMDVALPDVEARCSEAQANVDAPVQTVTYSHADLRALVMNDAGIAEDAIHSTYWDDDGSITFNLHYVEDEIPE